MDIKDNVVNEGYYFTPKGDDPCLSCTCHDGEPEMCVAALCERPQGCQHFRKDPKECCKFTCLDPGTDASHWSVCFMSAKLFSSYISAHRPKRWSFSHFYNMWFTATFDFLSAIVEGYFTNLLFKTSLQEVIFLFCHFSYFPQMGTACLTRWPAGWDWLSAASHPSSSSLCCSSWCTDSVSGGANASKHWLVETVSTNPVGHSYAPLCDD